MYILTSTFCTHFWSHLNILVSKENSRCAVIRLYLIQGTRKYIYLGFVKGLYPGANCMKLLPEKKKIW